jgi:hypothetical protein
VLEERPDYTSEISTINDSLIILQEQIDEIIIPDYTSYIRSFNLRVAAVQNQINSVIISPDYTSDISAINDSITSPESERVSIIILDYAIDISTINDMISTMKQSIIQLQDIIGDGNDADLTDINNSIASLQSQIDNMKSPKLI